MSHRGEPGARPRAVVAVDVGGTDIKGAILDAHRVLLRVTVPTRAGDGPEAALQNLTGTITRLLAAVPTDRRPCAVGLAIPGTVDDARGVCVHSENVGWRDLPIRDIVHEATGLPVGFGHDVRTGALAELEWGAGRRFNSVAYLSVGTGISAALLLDGHLIISGGWAGEVGHGGAVRGDLCACGGHGCAETFASAAAMARRYSRRSGIPVPGAREVLERARAGDTIAAEVWQDGLAGIARIVTQIVQVTGVENVVIGGGLIKAGDELLLPVRRLTADLLTIHRTPRILPAELGPEAGVLGAGLLAWRAAEQVEGITQTLDLPEGVVS